MMVILSTKFEETIAKLGQKYGRLFIFFSLKQDILEQQ